MKSIIKLWQTYKRELIVGVIVSIVTTFFWNIITWFVKEAPQVGTNIFETLRNLFYRLAATCTENSVSEMFSSVFLGVIFGVFFGSIYYLIKRRKILAKKENEEITSDSSKEEIKAKPKKQKHNYKVRLIFIIILLVFIFVLIMSYVIIPSDTYKRFNRDITMIAPYVEQQEIIDLKSKWVLMTSFEDYREIYATIDTVKENNNLPFK